MRPMVEGATADIATIEDLETAAVLFDLSGE
jgi:hypothetical protein